ncbi:hypothetical protein Ddc_21941 [Ditylenchus destructor]|nr:hypothetical protein Ddc_21941 [Ditylenchus destructor]
MPKSCNRYNNKSCKEKHSLLACRNKFKALDLDAPTEDMSDAKLLEIAKDWWDVIRKRLYSSKLLIPDFVIDQKIVRPYGTPLFGYTIIPSETDANQVIVVHICKATCKDLRLFVGTIMHEAAHVAAAYLFDEEDQTHGPNKGTQFRANVEEMHQKFGIAEPNFIDDDREAAPPPVASY